MPSAMTLTRYFGGLVRSHVEQLSAVLGQFVFGELTRPALGATLEQVVAMVTSRPAQVLGMSDSIGTLQPGACALLRADMGCN